MTTAQRHTIAETLGPAAIQIADALPLGPTTPAEREGSMMHRPQACEPNLGLQGQIVFVVLRAIAQDEERTFDDAMTDDNPDAAIPCHGGAVSCRGTITGRGWQREDLQRQYDGSCSWDSQRRIEARTPGVDTA